MARPTQGQTWPRAAQDGAPGANGADGTDGTDGANGTDGTNGQGVPAGGTLHQILRKASTTDYDTEWHDETAGSSALSSLTDVVIATPADADVLTYETSSSKWKNKPASGGGAASNPFFGTGSAGALSLKQTDSAPTWATKAGSGSAVVFSLSQDIYPSSLHLDDSAGAFALRTNGWRIFCSGTTTIDATAVLQNKGNDASGATGGGASPSSGTAPTNGNDAGGNGGSNATGSGSATPTGSGATRSTSNVASGGNGGHATTPGTGNGTTAGLIRGAVANGSFDNVQQAVTPFKFNSASKFDAGSGGAGGSGSTGPSVGGGGGGSGGFLVLCTKKLLNSGVIHCDGGKGADGVSGTNCGGGGGGGGGALMLVYLSSGSTKGTVRCTGGAGGAPRGTGGNGGAGADGIVFEFAL